MLNNKQLRLVNIDYLTCHHVDRDDFDETGLWFDEDLKELAPSAVHPLYGNRLELLRPSFS